MLISSPNQALNQEEEEIENSVPKIITDKNKNLKGTAEDDIRKGRELNPPKQN